MFLVSSWGEGEDGHVTSTEYNSVMAQEQSKYFLSSSIQEIHGTDPDVHFAEIKVSLLLIIQVNLDIFLYRYLDAGRIVYLHIKWSSQTQSVS